MKSPFEAASERELAELRAKVIGLGENSGRKSYYPELRRRLRELERFRALFDRSNDFVLILEASGGGIEDVNQTVCKNLGYAKDELLKLKIHDLIENFNEGQMLDVNVAVTFLKAKDGRKIPIEVKTNSIEISSARFNLIVARDITERQFTNQELIKAREKAESANRAKSEFLANMSHEIRTPLNSVLGFTELLGGTALNDDQRNYLQMIDRAGATLLSLINDVLDLSKVEAGRLKLEVVRFNLRDLVQDHFAIMAKNAKAKGLDANYSIDPGIPKELLGDPHRLRQIITNLLSNAIKFTQTGHVNLKVSLEKSDSTSFHLLFEISDTGVGIPPERIQELFGRFTQLDASVTRKFGGTGLGLNITKQLVELMGGNIWVESELGKGSVFRFRVPLAAHPAARPKPQEAGPRAPSLAVDPDRCSPLRILVAEDSNENRILIKTFLKAYPFEIVFAEDGSVALESFKRSEFDLVLMDMEMPILDGYSTTREIRKWEAEHGKKPTPIVAQSAHALHEKIQEMMQAGCDQHLPKPIFKSSLIGAIISLTGTGARSLNATSCSLPQNENV